MKPTRAPERVHVVRPPQDDYAPARDGRSIEIVRALAQISDKLKRSEAERYELLNELREYRKSLTELEDKTSQTEKAFITLEHKIQTQGAVDTEMTQRQARFEQALKETEERLVQTVAGHAVIDKRLKDAEDFQTGVYQRLDESVAAQTRLDRQIEKAFQDKARTLRKVERLEEIVAETQEALRARALVLLTDQSSAAQGAFRQLPALEDKSLDSAANAPALPWWKGRISMQSAGMGAMILTALLAGWALNQIQQPQIPQIAVLEGGGLARLNLDENRWEPVAPAPETPAPSNIADLGQLEKQRLDRRMEEAAPASAPAETVSPAPVPLEESPAAESAPVEQTPGAESILNYSDDQILAALEENPDALASALNDIAPSARAELDVTPPVADLPLDSALAQDPKIEKAVNVERSTQPISARAKPDAALPAGLRDMESKAFKGDAEAQHDLAAIYTAGQGGVQQDFEKAGFWFRAAADQGVANARYNLGVLYHQGLGVPRDLDRALYWYREAGKRGHPEAQYNLGIAHIEGIGTEYDPRRAAVFFERAARGGIMEAAYNLGLIHENGLLGKPDPQEALVWYKMAADKGSPDAKAAMEQLAKSLQIGVEDIGKLTERKKETQTR